MTHQPDTSSKASVTKSTNGERLRAANACDYRALSITPIGTESAAPVLYELLSDSTEIGSADDNAIVLSNADVAPHHFAVRRANGRDHLLVNLGGKWIRRERDWAKFRPGDAYWCPRHGNLERLDQRAWCPRCRRRRGSLWLLRPLAPGDSFDIGRAFRATYVVQERAAQPATIEPTRAYPPSEMFEKPAPSPHKIAIPVSAPQIPTRALPTDDSNLWRWQPQGVPFPIFLHQRVNRAITQHARQNSAYEVGGVLLGDVCQDESGQLYVVATHALKAEFADETRGHLTFTRKSWLKFHQTIEAHYPDKTIVGWYHTHPGWTIFLSEWDLFIHQNFFRQPWQVALVIDPLLDRAGFFVWKGDQVNNADAPVESFRLAEPDGGEDTTPLRVRIRLTDTNANVLNVERVSDDDANQNIG